MSLHVSPEFAWKAHKSIALHIHSRTCNRLRTRNPSKLQESHPESVFFLCSKWSSIRLLETCSGSSSSEFLWLTSSWISDEKTLVVLEKQILHLSLGRFVIVLLREGNDSLGDSLSDSHNLRALTTTTDSDAHVQVLEAVSSEKEDWLVCLHSKGGWFKNAQRSSVDTDVSGSLSACSDSSGVLFSSEGLNLLFLTSWHQSVSSI